jgi:hypothetical protein
MKKNKNKIQVKNGTQMSFKIIGERHTLTVLMQGSRTILSFLSTRQVTAATRHCNGKPESRSARHTALMEAASN